MERFEDKLRARREATSYKHALAGEFDYAVLTLPERDALAELVAAARWECDHCGASDVLLNALARLDGLPT